jgi:hypothetical protein
MVDQPALEHINELVVAARVGWHEEEPRVDKIANGIIDNSLHDFAIQKLNSHPNAMNDGRSRVEVEILVIRVSIETVDVKDCLDVLEGHLFDNI